MFHLLFSITAALLFAGTGGLKCATVLTEFAVLSNPLPSDGIYARVVPRTRAEAILSDDEPLARPNGEHEVFIAAYEDLEDIEDPRELAVRLSLYEDPAGRILRDTSDFVILKFRFRGDPLTLRSPTEFHRHREYGFKIGGQTGGGVREWLINHDANLTHEIEWVD